MAFPRAQVFQAWVSSDTVIAPAQRMHVEPWVGGVYQLFMDAGDTPSNAGRFLQVIPDAFLKYSWEWYGDGHVTEIDVRFTDAPGGTTVTLSHGPFSDPDSYAAHDTGWDSYIAGFERHLQSA
ncbi:SRPBCC family protein [Cognatishimia sp. SS12]|uniref:SRPBCC family protein n=1 Tax=Cognatishimia sp. SS12 TaxID=2979465 RepID=UPI00232D45C1|nr:SRPBCC domain-containing protein [Cognatishimia sp. SS12]